MNKSEEFVKIYNEIHEYMKEKKQVDNHRSFTRLIGETKEKDYIIKTYENYLIKFAQLRNIIVHENEIVAEPNDFSFSLIKKIRDKLINPPRVVPLFAKEVNTALAEDSITEIIKLMSEKSYSKIPLVASNQQFIGLLTSTAILKWLGEKENQKSSGLLINDIQARRILQYREKNHVFEFVDQNTKLIDIIKKYDKMHRTGKSLEAFLITADGSREKKIIGIITDRDIARVYRELEL